MSTTVVSNTEILDNDVQIMYLPKIRVPIGRERLKVNISRSYDRNILPEEYENFINEIWNLRIAKNPKIWNGTKFRIDSVIEDINKTEVTFNLGITSYKDFIGTNWSPQAQKLLHLGRVDHNNPQTYMSDALGVGAIVITADDQMILLKRSEHVAEAAGLWDIPGGHPEPKELVGPVNAEDIDVSSMKAESVIAEIFNSTLSEIVNEVNIPRDHLTDPVLIGIVRNTTSAGRPSSEYIVRCSLRSEEVERRYREGTHEEVDESTNIMFLPLSDVSTLQSKRPDLWLNLAPSAKGCLTLYRLINL